MLVYIKMENGIKRCFNCQRLWSCLIILLATIVLVAGKRQNTRGEVLGILLNESRYDSSIAPDFERDVATIINVQLRINNIYELSETSMDYSLDVVLKHTWADTRLQFKNLSDMEYLELDNKIMDKVWVPDTYFPNEKEASIHEVTTTNKLMRLYQNGTVLYSLRVALRLSCPMKLEKYPFDEQHCPIMIESYTYSLDNINLTWLEDKPVEMNMGLEMPQFQPSSVIRTDKNVSDYMWTGKFSLLIATLTLKRKEGYYIVQVFVPSILIVSLSWLSFWVDYDAVPARISLGVLTVLTMTTQSSGWRNSLPRVSYIKAVDVWMAACLIFVFAALLEYAWVNVLARRRFRVHKGMNGSSDMAEKGEMTRNLAALRARRLDKISRYAFPLAFLLFNVGFWVYYLVSPHRK